MTKVINIFGGPGSGKSTASLGLTHRMKLLQESVEVIPEYAKLLLWTNRLEDMQDQQEYMFAKQNHMLHSLRDKVDYVVVDSPILLNHMYTDLSNVPWAARDAFKSFVVASFHTYDNINILMDRPAYYEEAGRLQNKEQAIDIDHKIKLGLEMLCIEHTVVAADDATIDILLQIIK